MISEQSFYKNNQKMRIEKIIKLISALFFGIVAGVILSYTISVFVPQFYTESVGKLVCSGKIEYISFKQSYFCFTSANTSFNIDDAMFWVVFKRAILPAIAFATLLGIIFVKTVRFLWRHREAAGF
jgi:hypothetical protein